MGKDQTPVIKIVIAGPKSVGKTSLCHRWLKNNFDTVQPPKGKASIGVRVFQTDHLPVCHVQVWDLPSEPLVNMDHQYYKDIDALIIVADASNLESVDNILDHVNNMRENVPFDKLDSTPLGVALNKKDLVASDLDVNEIVNWKEQGLWFAFSVSARSGDGVSELFKDVVQRVFRKRGIKSIDPKQRAKPQLQHLDTRMWDQKAAEDRVKKRSKDIDFESMERGAVERRCSVM